MRKFPLLFILFISPWIRAASLCDSWLVETKAKPGTADCEIACSSSGTDMGTFECPLLCSDFCKTKNKCTVDKFWEKVLNASSHPFSSLKDQEREIVLKALGRLPKNFRPKSLKAIGKASSPDFAAPQNPASSSNELIILFPAIFVSTHNIERVLFHEATHHLMFNEWTRTFTKYKKENGWDKESENLSRKGQFVEPDGKFSAEEDFANNVEYFTFEPAKLKQLSPSIFNWIDKNLKNELRLERGCDERQNKKN